MFQFLGEILGFGFLICFGWLMFRKPFHFVKFDQAQHQIEKSVRETKRWGLAFMIWGGIMLIGFLGEQLFRW